MHGFLTTIIYFMSLRKGKISVRKFCSPDSEYFDCINMIRLTHSTEGS